ncbi:hypothetical protein VP01_2710g1 [Puccinia sorghi]|uniref:Uncharacterized protein n=1 Tax=Puccinia sorghi TaxID=27349 RepID=A0A0L6V3I6_9BASI|nr:hypothetical protein VP01_2710g1 [Puccinia sorghi]
MHTLLGQVQTMENQLKVVTWSDEFSFYLGGALFLLITRGISSTNRICLYGLHTGVVAWQLLKVMRQALLPFEVSGDDEMQGASWMLSILIARHVDSFGGIFSLRQETLVKKKADWFKLIEKQNTYSFDYAFNFLVTFFFFLAAIMNHKNDLPVEPVWSLYRQGGSCRSAVAAADDMEIIFRAFVGLSGLTFAFFSQNKQTSFGDGESAGGELEGGLVSGARVGIGGGLDGRKLFQRALQGARRAGGVLGGSRGCAAGGLGNEADAGAVKSRRATGSGNRWGFREGESLCTYLGYLLYYLHNKIGGKFGGFKLQNHQKGRKFTVSFQFAVCKER